MATSAVGANALEERIDCGIEENKGDYFSLVKTRSDTFPAETRVGEIGTNFILEPGFDAEMQSNQRVA